MPVRVKEGKPIIIKTEAGETFTCKNLNQKAVNVLYSQLGDFDEKAGEYVISAQKYPLYCYDLCGKMIIGWQGVVDEDGNLVPFKRELIAELDLDTVVEISSAYMEKRMGVEVERGEEVKNSPPTSPSTETSPPSEDADDVETTT